MAEFQKLWAKCFDSPSPDTTSLGTARLIPREETLAERFHHAAEADLPERPTLALREVELSIAAHQLEHVELLVRDSQEEKADRILAEIAELQAACGLDVDDPAVVKRRRLWAELLLRRGKLKEAKKVIDLVRDTRQTRGKPVEDPDTNHTLALIMRELGQTKAAEELMCRTLEPRRGMLGDDHRDTIRARRDLAAMRCQRGAGEQAYAELKAVYTLQTERFGPNDRDTLDSRLTLANLDLRDVRYSDLIENEIAAVRCRSLSYGRLVRRPLNVQPCLPSEGRSTR